MTHYTSMTPARVRALSQWIEAAEAWYEKGGCEACLQRQRRRRALQIFYQLVNETGLEVIITRNPETEILDIRAGDVRIPRELDPSDFPLPRRLLEGASPR